MGFHSMLALVFLFAFAILLLCIPGLSSVCSGILSSAAVSQCATSAYAIALKQLLHGTQNLLPMLVGAFFLFSSWPFELSLCWELHPKYYIWLELVVGIISVSLCTSVCQFVAVNVHLLLVCLLSGHCLITASGAVLLTAGTCSVILD